MSLVSEWGSFDCATASLLRSNRFAQDDRLFGAIYLDELARIVHCRECLLCGFQQGFCAYWTSGCVLHP